MNDSTSKLHAIEIMPHGADCSCGRRFSMWTGNHPRKTVESTRFRNLAIGNARRHADAANSKGKS